MVLAISIVINIILGLFIYLKLRKTKSEQDIIDERDVLLVDRHRDSQIKKVLRDVIKKKINDNDKIRKEIEDIKKGDTDLSSIPITDIW